MGKLDLSMGYMSKTGRFFLSEFPELMDFGLITFFQLEDILSPEKMEQRIIDRHNPHGFVL